MPARRARRPRASRPSATAGGCTRPHSTLRLPADPATWGAVLYLAIAGSVVTFLTYFWLLKTWRATTMSFIAVLTPLIAVLLGAVVLGERPTPWTGLGGVLILGGVTLAMLDRRA